MSRTWPPGCHRGEGRAGKAADGVWWHTIVPRPGRRRRAIHSEARRDRAPHGQASTRRAIGVSTFLRAGTLGVVAAKLGRRYVLIDNNPEAIRIAEQRLMAERVGIAKVDANEAGESATQGLF